MRAEPVITNARRNATTRQPSSRERGLDRWLWQPIDGASLAVFRMLFGVIMLWEVLRYFANDRIRRYYLEPGFAFKYFGFDWVKVWPGDGIYLHFLALGGFAILIALGVRQRLAAALFFLGFTYVFLLDQSYYLNHFYLVSLLSLLLVFVPASGAFSLVPNARSRAGQGVGLVPAWSLWLLRAQVGLVYVFGGIAKLNWDWLQGEPLRQWLPERQGAALIGGIMRQPWLPWVFAYAGLAFDLLVVPALLWSRTRPWALAVALLFHTINCLVFRIGIFPALMMAATLLFLPPEWPRRWLRGGMEAARDRLQAYRADLPSPRARSLTVACLCAYLGLQLLVPLRHWLYPGHVSWTEQGHRFSWRMKLRHKEAEARFFVTGANGQTQAVNPADILTRAQVEEMSARPDMILQFAHYLAEQARRSGSSNVAVRAMIRVSLNSRRPQLLVDPRVNLAEERRTLGSAAWILPLRETLEGP